MSVRHGCPNEVAPSEKKQEREPNQPFCRQKIVVVKHVGHTMILCLTKINSMVTDVCRNGLTDERTDESKCLCTYNIGGIKGSIYLFRFKQRGNKHDMFQRKPIYLFIHDLCLRNLFVGLIQLIPFIGSFEVNELRTWILLL